MLLVNNGGKKHRISQQLGHDMVHGPKSRSAKGWQYLLRDIEYGNFERRAVF